MNKQRVDDLMSAFRKVHGQIQTSVNTTTKGIPKKREKRNITSEKYSKFMEKYNDLENSYDKFKTQDLVYFFREKAREAGVKYVIANMLANVLTIIAIIWDKSRLLANILAISFHRI